MSETIEELRRKEISRREFLRYMMLLATGMIFAPMIIKAQDLKNTVLMKPKGQPSSLLLLSTTIPKLDYEDLSLNWWRWILSNQHFVFQPEGIIFLPSMTGGYTEHVIKAKTGDRLFFSPAKYNGPQDKDDIDSKVTYEVSFGDIPVYYVGRIKTRKTFNSVTDGPNSISDGHWYISEPLKPGQYIAITEGRVPTGNFWEKTRYVITVS